MKRFIPCLLAILFCCACVATPNQEIVVNKGDGAFENLITVTAAPEQITPPSNNSTNSKPEDPQINTVIDEPIIKPAQSTEIPDHWNGNIATKHFLIEIDAKIESNGHPCPIRKVQRHTFSARELSQYASIILPAVTAVWETDMPSKQEYEAAITSLSNRGMAEKAKDTYLEMQDIVNLKNENFAPTNEIICSSDGSRQTYFCSNGKYATVSGFQNSIVINTSRHATIHGEEMLKAEGHFIGEGPVYLSTTLSQEKAEEVLFAFLVEAGIEGYHICSAEKASYYDTIALMEIDQGWYFRLVNSNEYVPIETQRNGLGEGLFRFDAEAKYSAPWPDETMLVFVGENGIQYFMWTDPIEVNEITNPDVQLLSFTDIKQRISNFLRIGVSYMTMQYAATGKLSRMILGQQLVPVKDEPGSAYLIPAWICEIEMYDIFSGNYDYSEFCCFNAVDGSPII